MRANAFTYAFFAGADSVDLLGVDLVSVVPLLVSDAGFVVDDSLPPSLFDSVVPALAGVPLEPLRA